MNNRDKVIPLKELEVTAIQKKVQLLLDASGAKIVPLKRRAVESTTEAARGDLERTARRAPDTVMSGRAKYGL